MSNEQEYDLQTNIQEVLGLIHTPGGGSGDTNIDTDEEERETIHVYPVEGGGILFTRTPIEPEEEDLDTAPLTARQATSTGETGIVYFGLLVTLLCLFCIVSQFYLIVNPFTVTVTLLAKSEQLTLQGTLQLGRVLNPITISQSQTTQTTGHGHQDARAATGSITFYNGQPAQQFVPAGTMLTGNDSVQVVTDADANIPAGNPPAYGEVSVSAHASNSGSAGNIQALDINTTVNAVFVKNLSAFSGGQDERDFQTVTKTDIANTASPLKATLAQSVQGALQGQLKPNEALVTPSCATTTTSDHQPGQEATTVKVTASETCSAIAYNSQELTDKVTQLLTSQAETKLGAGYSILENPHITVTSATASKQIMLSFSSVSTWIYALSSADQQHIKNIIAGKNTEKALQLLAALPGIEHVSMHFAGFGDATRIPKDLAYIHLLIFYGL